MTAVQSDIALLKAAFDRFNETGSVLSEKYVELQKEAEALREQLKEKEIEAKRNERLAMIGETAAALAHEIRNPLGAMRLFVSLLEEDTSDPVETEKLLSQIQASINRLDAAVSNVLHFSIQKKLEKSPVNLHSIVQEQISLFGATDQEIYFVTDIAGSPYIYGEPESLRRALYNLFLNAKQALLGRGIIRVSTWSDSSNYAVLKIEDNGPGIPSDILSKVFEPFVSSRKEGTGLGLAIVRQILDQHGARITVENTSGACFTIYFPKTSGSSDPQGGLNGRED